MSKPSNIVVPPQITAQVDQFLQAVASSVKNKSATKPEQLISLISSDNPKIRENAIILCTNFCFEPKNRDILRDEGVFPVFLNLLKDPSPSILKHASLAVMSLASNDANKDFIRTNNGLPLIFQVFSTTNDSSILSNMAQTVLLLSTNATNRDLIGGSKPYIQSLAQALFPTKPNAEIKLDQQLIEKLMGGLINLSTTKIGKETTLREGGAITSMIKTLQHRPDENELATKAFTCFFNLSSVDANRDSIRVDGGLPLLVGKLKLPQPQNDQLISVALRTLSNLSVDKETSVYFSKNNLFPDLVKTLTSSNENIISYAISTLQNLINLEDDNCMDLMHKAGTLSIITNLVSTYAKKPPPAAGAAPNQAAQVQQLILSRGVLILGELLSLQEVQQEFVDAKGVELLLTLLDNQIIDVVRNAARSIANFCQYHDSVRAKFGPAKGIGKVVNLFSSKDRELIKQASRCLTNLALNKANAELILKSGIAENILALSRVNDKDLKILALKILVNLTVHDNARIAIGNLGCVALSFQLLTDPDLEIQLQGAKLLTNFAIYGKNRKEITERGQIKTLETYSKSLDKLVASSPIAASIKSQIDIALGNLSFPYEKHYDDLNFEISKKMPSLAVVEEEEKISRELDQRAQEAERAQREQEEHEAMLELIRNEKIAEQKRIQAEKLELEKEKKKIEARRKEEERQKALQEKLRLEEETRIKKEEEEKRKLEQKLKEERERKLKEEKERILKLEKERREREERERIAREEQLRKELLEREERDRKEREEQERKLKQLEDERKVQEEKRKIEELKRREEMIHEEKRRMDEMRRKEEILRKEKEENERRLLEERLKREKEERELAEKIERELREKEEREYQEKIEKEKRALAEKLAREEKERKEREEREAKQKKEREEEEEKLRKMEEQLRMREESVTQKDSFIENMVNSEASSSSSSTTTTTTTANTPTPTPTPTSVATKATSSKTIPPQVAPTPTSSSSKPTYNPPTATASKSTPVVTPPISTQPSQPTQPSNAEKLAKRTKIAQEILSVERGYCRNLDVVVTKFLNPLMSSSTSRKPILHLDKIKKIFSIIEVIFNYNSLLLEGLEGRVKRWLADEQKTPLSIGNIFVKMCDYLQCYSTYINNYNDAVNTLREQKKTNSPFAQFVHTAEQDPDCRFQELESFLINPVQQLPRYILLLSDLLKNTPSDHPDMEPVSQAVQKMKHLTEFVNESKRAAEDSAKMATCQQQIKKVNILVSGRKHVKEGTCQFVEGGKKEGKDRETEYIFLFNDLLLFTRKKSTNPLQYKVVEQMPLSNTVFLSTGTEATGDEKTLKIRDSATGKWFSMSFPTPTDKQTWLKSFTMVLTMTSLTISKKK